MCCLQHFKLKHEPVIWCQCFDLEWQKSKFFLCAFSSPNSRNDLLEGQGDAACRAALLPWEAGRGAKHKLPVLISVDPRKCLKSWSIELSLSQDCLDKTHECLHKSAIQKMFFKNLIKSCIALIYNLNSNFGRNLKTCSSAFGAQVTVLLLGITT